MIRTLARIFTVAAELLTASFLKEESFKSNLKGRVGVSPFFLDTELLPQQGAQMDKDLGTRSIFKDSGNCEQTSSPRE